MSRFSKNFQRLQRGIILYQDGGEIYEDYYYSGNIETVEWVTPVTVYNRQKEAFLSHGQECLTWECGDVCMVVRIGKAGDRLAYPRFAQVEKAYKQSGYDREYF